jgi:hypothetical protein
MRPFSVPLATNIVHGEIAGSATAAVLPSIPCLYAVLKAPTDNQLAVYIGSSSAVTKADGTADATTGFPLYPGDEMEVYVQNLNLLYLIGTNATDDLCYIAYR